MRLIPKNENTTIKLFKKAIEINKNKITRYQEQIKKIQNENKELEISLKNMEEKQ